MTQKGETLVEVKDLCKNFGVTIALSHVDFVVKTGEIRGLIGENGSGKSTVSSIIAGMQPASSGEMFYKGKPWKPATMLEAQKAGIGMIVQEAGTIANISVAENIFLGNYDKFKKGPIINKVAMISEARKALEKIGVTNINPALPARHYDMQERKLIEIAKCMYNDPELLIVDETTTALSQSGRDIIYRIMHEMADAGKPGVSILSNWGFIIVVTLLVMLVMTYLFQYSGFGYNRRAIQGNQKLAHDAGINIYKNAFLCYVAAGALVAIAGVFDTAYKSSLVPVLGMNSNSTVFANMFPMAVGVWLSKKSNPVVGILAGSLSVQFLILGLAKFTAIGVSDYMQTCIKYSVWLIFMIYRMNEDKFDHIKAKHARIALARKTRAQRAVAA